MKSILQNEYSIYLLTFITGIVFGRFILKPLIQVFKSRATKKGFPYLSELLNTFTRISPVAGLVLALNVLHIEKLSGIKSVELISSIRILTVVLFTYLAGEVLVFIYDKYSKARTGRATSLYHIIIRLLTYISGLVFVFDVLGIQVAPILTALGVGGLAVALALQDTLSNLFSGVHILAAGQLKPGDYIRLDSGEEGVVVDINWRNTEIKTREENIVIIPNSKIASTVTTNYSTIQKNLFFQVSVGVHYDSDLNQVERITLDVAKQLLSERPNIPESFEPRVRFVEFADSSINLTVWLAADYYENQFALRHEFIKRLHQKYNEAGIVIPYPIRTIQIEMEP